MINTDLQYYQESNFNDFLEAADITVAELWGENVKDKILKTSHKYVERTEDYEDFVISVSEFFALYVALARKFAKFYNSNELIYEYLKQRNIYVCSNETLDNMYRLMERQYASMSLRGTSQIYSEDIQAIIDESISGSESENENPLKGEFLRLLCHNDCDEFMFDLCRQDQVGWVIGSSSPLWHGFIEHQNVNKAYEQGGVSDLSKYPVLNPDYVEVIVDDENSFIQIENVPSGETAGIGGDDFSKGIKVDQNLDYEISFEVKQTGTFGGLDLSESSEYLEPDGNITFALKAYDCSGNLVDLYDLRFRETGNDFFVEKQVGANGNVVYKVRGIVWGKSKFPDYDEETEYAKGTIVYAADGNYYKAIIPVPLNEPPQSSPTYWEQISEYDLMPALLTNVNIGSSLRFNENVAYIVPQILLDNTNDMGGSLLIREMTVVPLYTDYSHGFIHVPNFIHIWAKNRNGEYSISGIKRILRQYLLPYNCTFMINEIGVDETLLIPPPSGDFNDDFNEDFDNGNDIAPPTVLNVGDSHQGGIITYLLQPGDSGYDENVQHGLIAAVDDLPLSGWGCSGTSVAVVDSSIGGGEDNTAAIISACAQANTAARRCNDLDINGYSDWYLPNPAEINATFNNNSLLPSGLFPNSGYWSSSQYLGITTLAIAFSWTGGGFSSPNKTTQLRPKPFRKF